jgi:hypothetical protein
MNRALRRRHRYVWVVLTLVVATTLILAWRARLHGSDNPPVPASQEDGEP